MSQNDATNIPYSLNLWTHFINNYLKIITEISWQFEGFNKEAIPNIIINPIPYASDQSMRAHFSERISKQVMLCAGH